MNAELVQAQPKDLAAPIQWSREQVELVKRTVAKGATDDELQLFLHVAKRTGLDPFARQIYAIKRWDSREKKEVMQPQTSIDGYRLIAERTGKYAPGREPSYTYEADGKTLKSATAYVQKLVGDKWFEVAATAFYSEYVQVFNGKVGHMWEKMPHVMLAKCAESLAIRRAFPNEVQGIYTIEEMSSANAEVPASSSAIKMPESTDDAPYEVNPETGEIIENQAAMEMQAPAPSPSGKLSVKQQGYLFGLAKKKGWSEDDVKAYSSKFFGKPDPTAMSFKELDKVLTVLKSMPDATK